MQKKLTGKAMFLFCLGDFSRAIFNGLTATYLMYLFIPGENSSLPLLLPYGALTFAVIRGIGVIFDALIDPFIASARASRFYGSPPSPWAYSPC